MGVTEALGLLERVIPPTFQRNVMPIFLKSPLASSYVNSKSLMIFHKNFDPVEQSLRNLAEDVRSGIKMSNDVSESMFLPAIMDQIFKHAEKVGDGDKDPSSVFMRVRY